MRSRCIQSRHSISLCLQLFEEEEEDMKPNNLGVCSASAGLEMSKQRKGQGHQNNRANVCFNIKIWSPYLSAIRLQDALGSVDDASALLKKIGERCIGI